MKGEAVDFIAPKYGIPALIAKKLFENVAVLNYDQLIMEQTWVHISFTSSGTPRNELLTFLGKGKYMPGIRDKEGNTIDFHAYGIGEN
jgi:hypothetical protein